MYECLSESILSKGVTREDTRANVYTNKQHDSTLLFDLVCMKSEVPYVSLRKSGTHTNRSMLDILSDEGKSHRYLTGEIMRRRCRR